MKKIKVLQLGIAAILLLCAVSCQNEKPVKKEPSIELTQSELMVIYENGYLNGKINCQLHSTDGKSAEIWSIDSATMSKRFFK